MGHKQNPSAQDGGDLTADERAASVCLECVVPELDELNGVCRESSGLSIALASKHGETAIWQKLGNLAAGAVSFGQHLANTADLRAYAFEFSFNVFVTAVNVVNAVNNGFAIRHQGGKDQRRGSTQV